MKHRVRPGTQVQDVSGLRSRYPDLRAQTKSGFQDILPVLGVELGRQVIQQQDRPLVVGETLGLRQEQGGRQEFLLAS